MRMKLFCLLITLFVATFGISVANADAYGDYPTYNQRIITGNIPGSDYSVKDYGCAICAVASMLSHYGAQCTPTNLIDWGTDRGYWEPITGFINWPKPVGSALQNPDRFPCPVDIKYERVLDVDYEVEYTAEEYQSRLDLVKQYYDNGWSVLVETRKYNGTRWVTHWTVVRSYEANSDQSGQTQDYNDTTWNYVQYDYKFLLADSYYAFSPYYDRGVYLNEYPHLNKITAIQAYRAISTPTTLACHSSDYGCDNSGKVCVKLTDSDNQIISGKPINFSWAGGTGSGTTDAEGVACVGLHDLSPGTHSINASFKGDSEYGAFSTDCSVTAPRHTVLTPDIPTLHCGDATNLCAYLKIKDEPDNPVADATVHFSINGNSLPAGTTGPDGRACSPWTPGLTGEYTLACSFDKDDTRLLCPTSSPWQVQVDADPTITTAPDRAANCSDPFTLKACLTDDENVPLVGYKMRFDLEGETYYATTDTYGCCETTTINRCLGVGTYSFTATWDGNIKVNNKWVSDECYAASNKQANLVISCDPTSITDNESLPHVVQYSDVLSLGAWLKDDEGLELTGKLLGFNVGNQHCEDYTGPDGATGCQVDNDLTGRNGYASCSIIIDQPASSPACDYWFEGDNCYCPSIIHPIVEITCEKATIECLWEVLMPCDGTVSNGGSTILLKASITEEADGSYGDITKAGNLCFDIYDYNDTLVKTVCAPVVAMTNPITEGPPTIGYAEKSVQLQEGFYWIKVRQDNQSYYCSEVVEDCLIIYCDGFVTGGGWITQPDGVKKNFGFNLKYKKNSKTVPQGQFQYIDHALGLKLHSTSWEWLVVDEVNRVAFFQGKGTINQAGCFSFLVKVEDKDEPGHPTDDGDLVFDTFSITMKPCGTNGFPYPCADPDICPIRDGEYKIENCPLGGGNIQIHKPHSQ